MTWQREWVAFMSGVVVFALLSVAGLMVVPDAPLWLVRTAPGALGFAVWVRVGRRLRRSGTTAAELGG